MEHIIYDGGTVPPLALISNVELSAELHDELAHNELMREFAVILDKEHRFLLEKYTAMREASMQQQLASATSQVTHLRKLVTSRANASATPSPLPDEVQQGHHLTAVELSTPTLPSPGSSPPLLTAEVSVPALTSALAAARRDALAAVADRDLAILDSRRARDATAAANARAAEAIARTEALSASAARADELAAEVLALRQTICERNASIQTMSAAVIAKGQELDAAISNAVAERDAVAHSARAMVEHESASAYDRGYDAGWAACDAAARVATGALHRSLSNSVNILYTSKSTMSNSMITTISAIVASANEFAVSSAALVARTEADARLAVLQQQEAVARSKVIFAWASSLCSGVAAAGSDGVRSAAQVAMSARAAQRAAESEAAAAFAAAEAAAVAADSRASDAVAHAAEHIGALRDEVTALRAAALSATDAACESASEVAALRAALADAVAAAEAAKAAASGEMACVARSNELAEVAAAGWRDRLSTLEAEAATLRSAKATADTAARAATAVAADAIETARACVRRLIRDGAAAVAAAVDAHAAPFMATVTELESRATRLEATVGHTTAAAVRVGGQSAAGLAASHSFAASGIGPGGSAVGGALHGSPLAPTSTTLHTLSVIASTIANASDFTMSLAEGTGDVASAVEAAQAVVRDCTQNSAALDRSAAAMGGKLRAALASAEAEAAAAARAVARATETAADGARRLLSAEGSAAATAAAALANARAENERVAAAAAAATARLHEALDEAEAGARAARAAEAAANTRVVAAEAQAAAAERRAADAEGAQSLLDAAMERMRRRCETADSAAAAAVTAAAAAEATAAAASSRADASHAAAMAAERRAASAESLVATADAEARRLGSALRAASDELRRLQDAEAARAAAAAVDNASTAASAAAAAAVAAARIARLEEELNDATRAMATADAAAAAAAAAARAEQHALRAAVERAEAAAEAATTAATAAEREMVAQAAALEADMRAAVAAARDDAAAAAAAAMATASGTQRDAVERALRSEASAAEYATRVARLEARLGDRDAEIAVAASAVRRAEDDRNVVALVAGEARARAQLGEMAAAARAATSLAFAVGLASTAATSASRAAVAAAYVASLERDNLRLQSLASNLDSDAAAARARAEELSRTCSEAEAAAALARAERDAVQELLYLLQRRLDREIVGAQPIGSTAGTHVVAPGASFSDGDQYSDVGHASDGSPGGSFAGGHMPQRRPGAALPSDDGTSTPHSHANLEGGSPVSPYAARAPLPHPQALPPPHGGHHARGQPAPHGAGADVAPPMGMLRALSEEVVILKSRLATSEASRDSLRAQLAASAETTSAGATASASADALRKQLEAAHREVRVLRAAAEGSDAVSEIADLQSRLRAMEQTHTAQTAAHQRQLQHLRAAKRRLTALVEVGIGTEQQRGEMMEMLTGIATSTSEAAARLRAALLGAPLWTTLTDQVAGVGGRSIAIGVGEEELVMAIAAAERVLRNSSSTVTNATRAYRAQLHVASGLVSAERVGEPTPTPISVPVGPRHRHADSVAHRGAAAGGRTARGPRADGTLGASASPLRLGVDASSPPWDSTADPSSPSVALGPQAPPAGPSCRLSPSSRPSASAAGFAAADPPPHLKDSCDSSGLSGGRGDAGAFHPPAARAGRDADDVPAAFSEATASVPASAPVNRKEMRRERAADRVRREAQAFLNSLL